MKNKSKGSFKILIFLFVVVVIVVAIIYYFTRGQKGPGFKEEEKGVGEIKKVADLLAKGKILYEKYCMNCHGEKGDGNGIFAKYVYPKPRDFTKGIFKLRSTPSGKVPTDEDLIITISKGMPGTAMVSFRFLEDNEIRSIVEYIKTFSQKCSGEKCINFFEVRKSPSVEIPAKLAKTEELLILGKEFYKEVGCWKCHGEKGKGDGPQAGEQKDSWGYPIKVRDFTKGIYLGGNREEDLMKRFLTGMDGTPMPSFVEGIENVAGPDKEKQRQLMWGLVYYVKSLEEKDVKIASPPVDSMVRASKVADDFNFAIDAKEWKTATTYEIPVSRLWQLEENYKILYVKVLYTSTKIAILVEYDDKTHDTQNYKFGEFQDMVAIQFSRDDKPGFIGMGNKDSPVYIWLYKPDWQFNINQNSSKKIYVNLADDLYFLDIVKGDKDLFYTSRAAGNLRLSQIQFPIENLTAHGAETISSRAISSQNIAGRGMWNNGKWQVLFIRELKTDQRDEIQIEPGRKIPIAFAVWDGSQHDRNGQKLISTWYYLYLE
ncbi:MAG: ethylbenzene dehydrogenase-related protein [Planctomycetota bacterium]